MRLPRDRVAVVGRLEPEREVNFAAKATLASGLCRGQEAVPGIADLAVRAL